MLLQNMQRTEAVIPSVIPSGNAGLKGKEKAIQRNWRNSENKNLKTRRH